MRVWIGGFHGGRLETNEVVRHIPSDEVIAMAEYIEQWIPDAEDVMPQGILFDGLV